MVARVYGAVGVVVATFARAVGAWATGIDIRTLDIHLHPAVTTRGTGLALTIVKHHQITLTGYC